MCSEAFAHMGWGEEAVGRDGPSPESESAREGAIEAFGSRCANGWLKVKAERAAEDAGLIEF